MTALMSCYDTATVVCDNDGLRCPVGKVCVLEGTLCVDPGQEDEAEMCRGRNENAECGDQPDPGHCKDGICVYNLCGNMVKEPWETCDKGIDPNKCNEDCSLACGNGIKEDGEDCDRGLPPESCLKLGFDLGTAPCADDCQDYDMTGCLNLGWVKSEAIPEDWHLLGVWAFAKDNVFAVGINIDTDTDTPLTPETGKALIKECLIRRCGIVVHYDGTKWTLVDEGPTGAVVLTDIWASAPDDIYVVGLFGEAWHFDGEGWHDISLDRQDMHLIAVWGDEGSLIAVGASVSLADTESRPVIVRRHDGEWKDIELPVDVQQSNSYFLSVWGDGLGGWFVGGKSGEWLRYDDDAQAWDAIDDVSPIASRTTFSVSGDLKGNVLFTEEAGGTVLYDGREWKQPPSGTQVDLLDSWTDGDGTWFAVGGAGTILRRTGTEPAWVKEQSNSMAYLTAVHGSPDGYVVAVGVEGTILSRQPGWSRVPTPVEVNEIVALRGIPGQCLYAASYDGYVFEYDLNEDDGWRIRIESPRASFVDLLVRDCTDVTVANRRTIFEVGHGDTGLIPHSVPQDVVISAIWGDRDGGFAVGENGLILRQAGPGIPEWIATTPAVTANDLIKIWGSNSRNVFAIDYHGLTLRFDGSMWTSLDVAGVGLWDVAGDHDGNLYVVSDWGYIRIRDPQNNWSTIKVDFNTIGGLRTILPVDAGKVFVAGESGFLSFYDGETWTPINTPTDGEIQSLWSNGWPGDLYIGTADGAIHRLDTSVLPAPTSTSTTQAE
ncbi:WD40/YVTN/BNR-like repeat-containing protein [Haliangium sp.]|uniref:WD40/YVTN/BNR-like repeat-containing protein n=2 Tax=Haliangium sp. TaxID=2663208 RepID=UPI003D0AB0A9